MPQRSSNSPFWRGCPGGSAQSAGGALVYRVSPTRPVALHFHLQDYSRFPGLATAPLQAAAAPRHFPEWGIFPDLPAPRDLVQRFATPAGLQSKREIFDEYGWRNFGDIYADHEAVSQGGVSFVSVRRPGSWLSLPLARLPCTWRSCCKTGESGTLAQAPARPSEIAHTPAVRWGRPTPFLGAGAATCRFCSDILRALAHLGIKREAAWSRAEMGK